MKKLPTAVTNKVQETIDHLIEECQDLCRESCLQFPNTFHGKNADSLQESIYVYMISQIKKGLN